MSLRLASLCVLLLLAACARSEPTPEAAAPTPPPAVAVPPTPTASPTPTPLPPTPDIPFEESLQSDDLVKYQAIPPEFQDALQQEAEETGNEKAIQYLRGLPDETVPIAELLDPSVLSWLPFKALDLFNKLDAARQRSLLVGGYADAVRHYVDGFQLYADKHGEEELDPKGHAVLFAQMVELAFQDDTGKLPPLNETLSVEALAKLDALDPLMQRAFRRTWDRYRAPPPLDLRQAQTEQTEGVVASLESVLLAAPTELPSIEDLGLSSERTDLFKQLPADMQDWLWEDIAGELVRGRDPKDSHIFREEFLLLETWSTPAAKETFARGYMPAPAGGFTMPLACGGRPPHGAARLLPEDLPDRPVFLPPPQEVLSAEALARLDTMDSVLQRAFDESWLGGGPVMPQHLACQIVRLELNILAAPVTAVPALEDLLPPEAVELYGRLPAERRESLETRLASAILYRPMGYPGAFAAARSAVPFEDPDLGAFLEALRSFVEHQLWMLASLERPPAGAQQSDATEPLTPPPSEAAPLGDDVAKYQTLPSEILDAIREEIERVPPDARPTLPGPVSIQDVLDPDEQDLFDRLPVALKEMFWRVVARELVYGSAIQTVGGKLIGNVRTTAKHWVRFASQAPPSR